ncbi:MAG: DUF4129 domain-containing protein [Infirmifilum sp.]
MPPRRELLLLPLVTLAILFSSYGGERKVVFPGVNEEDAFALIFLAFISFLAINIILMRHEIADIIKELLRSDKEELTGQRRNFLLSFIFNLIILLVLFLLVSRNKPSPPLENYSQSLQVYNGTFMNTSARPEAVQPLILAHQTSGGEGLLYHYTPVIILLISTIVVFSLILAFHEKTDASAIDSSHSFQSQLLRETTIALGQLKANMDIRATIIELYTSFCRELTKRRLRIGGEMTAREIMNETMMLIPSIPRKPLEDLTYLFEKALYSNHPLLTDDKIKAENALTEIIVSLKNASRSEELEEG